MTDTLIKKKSRLKSEDSNVVALDTNSNVLWNEGYTDKVDLNALINGVPEKRNHSDVYAPFEGQPRFINEIRSALKRVVWEKTSTSAINTYLNSLLGFLTDTSRQNFTLDQLSSELLAEHRNYLERKYKLSSGTISVLQVVGNNLCKELNAEHSSQYPNLSMRNNAAISYPSVKVSRNKGTKEISTFAFEYIYDYCKAYLNNIDTNPYANYEFVEGNDPRNLSHQLYAVNDIIQKTLLGEKFKTIESLNKRFWFDEYGFERRPFNQDGTFLTSDLASTNVIEYLYPSVSEAAATALMISHETAWIDTALNFNISDDWYHTDADDPKNPRASDGVTMYAQRPKTHTSKEEPKAAHSSGRHGSAFSVIKRIIARTERLRNHVERELKSNTLSKPERVTLEAALRNPVIYLAKKPWGVRTPVSHDILQFLDAIKKYATQDPRLTQEQIDEIQAFTWKDSKDALVLSKYEQNGDIFEAQRLAGHKSVTTTFEYLKDRKFKSEMFATFANVSGIIYDEVSNGHTIDKNIIRARVLKNDDLTDDERAELSGMTASGARCKDIENPPSEIGNLGKGACLQQSCVLCPNAVFIPQEKRALKVFALRFAEVTFKANNLAPDRFNNSILEAELVALEKYKSEFFADRLDEFEEIFEHRLKRLEEVKEVA